MNKLHREGKGLVLVGGFNLDVNKSNILSCFYPS